MQAPWIVQEVAVILWALPAPTPSWASIVNSVAWPGAIAILVFRFRRYLRTFLNTIADRLVTDHVKLGPFELTPNSQVFQLDGEDFEDEVESSKEDMHATDDLWEFMSSASGEAKIRAWVNKNCGPELSLLDFLTEPAYDAERLTSARELKGE